MVLKLLSTVFFLFIFLDDTSQVYVDVLVYYFSNAKNVSLENAAHLYGWEGVKKFNFLSTKQFWIFSLSLFLSFFWVLSSFSFPFPPPLTTFFRFFILKNYPYIFDFRRIERDKPVCKMCTVYTSYIRPCFSLHVNVRIRVIFFFFTFFFLFAFECFKFQEYWIWMVCEKKK